VQTAVQGQSGYMVKLVRESDEPYRWTTGLQPLDDIANLEHFIPRDWISEDGWLPNEKFETYARPLIQGELHLPTKGGLPAFARLKKIAVEKKLPAREA
jgi:6-phosphofructokinase 1